MIKKISLFCQLQLTKCYKSGSLVYFCYDKSSFKGERCDLANHLREGRHTALRGSWSHCTCSQEAIGSQCCYSPHFKQSWTSADRVMAPTLKNIKPFWRYSHGDPDWYASMMTLNLVKLKINTLQH